MYLRNVRQLDRHSNIQACKVLLDGGVPLDRKASSGGTALMFAAAAGYTDVVKLLLERGADVNARVEVSRFRSSLFGFCNSDRCTRFHIECVASLVILDHRVRLTHCRSVSVGRENETIQGRDILLQQLYASLHPQRSTCVKINPCKSLVLPLW